MKSITKERINYPVLKADKVGNVTCPFCLQKHKHGKGGGNGHRVADCTQLLIVNPVFINGLWHWKKDGYFVEFP